MCVFKITGFLYFYKTHLIIIEQWLERKALISAYTVQGSSLKWPGNQIHGGLVSMYDILHLASEPVVGSQGSWGYPREEAA